MRLSGSFVFLASLFFVAVLPIRAFSYSQDISSLEGVEFYLFTNPQECVPCAYLAKALEISGQTSAIVVESNGRKVKLNIKRFDPWSDKADKKYLARIGYLGVAIPQFALVKKGKVIGKGRPIPTVASMNKDERNELLPAESEDISSYYNRITKNYTARISKFDMTEAVLKSLNLLKNEPELRELDVHLGDTNILVAGTAGNPLGNPIYTGITIKKVISALAEVTPIHPVVLYGGGKSPRSDTCELLPGVDLDAEIEDKDQYLKQRRLVKVAGLQPDESFTTSNVRTFFEQSRAEKVKKNLIVLVGHGSKEGAVTWMEQSDLKPKDLKEYSDKSGSENVLVSGNCYGGVMAQAMTCGFMAAPPHRTAAGCWEDADSGNNIPDYVSVFFKSLSDKSADANGDGKISFIEAHSYAVPKVDNQDSPYTTMDDFASTYFSLKSDELPDEVQVMYAQSILLKYASPAEKKLLAELTKGMNSKTFLKMSFAGEETLDGQIKVSYSYDPKEDGEPKVSLERILNYKALGLSPVSGAEYETIYDEGVIYLYRVTKAGKSADALSVDVDIVKEFDLPQSLKLALSPEADRLRTLVRRLVFKSAIADSKALQEHVDRVSRCENQSIEEFLGKK